MKCRGRIAVAAMCAVALTVSSSCATLFSSSSVTVQMESDPPGAKYEIGPFSGKTPDSIAIPKKAIPDFATFELAGYERRTVPVESGITGVFWLDILFWPGLIVDMVTGDYKTLDVPEIRADLTPVASTSTAAVPTTARQAATPPTAARVSQPVVAAPAAPVAVARPATAAPAAPSQKSVVAPAAPGS
jgi:hypothetical protein